MKKFLLVCVGIVSALAIALVTLSQGVVPLQFQYGVTFSAPHARDIGLDWKEVYTAMLDDLGVRRMRLAAYWDEIEPTRGEFTWDDLDYQIAEAKKRDAEVILSVGRRLPRWPECHVPGWADTLVWEEQKQEALRQITAVIERYKHERTIVMWQVENEPYLTAFATEHCGWLDEDFFKDEIAHVRSLDSRPIMVTDGGNFGLWYGAYRAGDVFGTSMYLYFWRPDVGLFRSALPPAYYHAKSNLMRLLFGEKKIVLSDLSLEPWLGAHIDDVSIESQIERMSTEKMREIVEYARQSPFDTQYLWGVEWWYWMKQKGHPEFWDFAKRLYAGDI